MKTLSIKNVSPNDLPDRKEGKIQSTLPVAASLTGMSGGLDMILTIVGMCKWGHGEFILYHADSPTKSDLSLQKSRVHRLRFGAIESLFEAGGIEGISQFGSSSNRGNAEMTVRALFVDDDPALLASIRRQLFALRAKWDVAFVERGAEALQVLEESPVDIVISDMRMPEMDGAEFIAQVKERWPDTIRVILSGQSESHQVEQVLGTAHLLLKKPCETRTIFNLGNRCAELRQRLLSTSISKLITSRDQWVGSSRAVSELLRLLREPDTSIEKVSETISRDLVISARVLGFVNSAFFGLSRHISSIEQAVVLLGVNAIKSIYTSLKAKEFVSLSGLANDLAEQGMTHGIEIGELSCEILKERHANPEWQADCYLAGMLHDIGMPILATIAEKDYSQILEQVGWDKGCKDHAKLMELEHERFGCSHPEAGAYQLAIWGFDPRVLEAVLKHHDDSLLNEEGPFAIAHAVHQACSKIALGQSQSV